MFDATAGAIIGPVWEANPAKVKLFPGFHPHGQFTDNTVYGR